MIKVKKNIGAGKFIYISLQDYVNEYHNEVSDAWDRYIKEWVNEGMSISNQEEYKKYLMKLNLKSFDYKNVIGFYLNLKNSKYGEMLTDDVLRFIAHIYGLGYFARTNYDIDIFKPNLDNWLKTKNVFQPQHEKIPPDEKFSLMDLLSLDNGLNAFKNTLLFALKW